MSTTELIQTYIATIKHPDVKSFAGAYVAAIIHNRPEPSPRTFGLSEKDVREVYRNVYEVLK